VQQREAQREHPIRCLFLSATFSILYSLSIVIILFSKLINLLNLLLQVLSSLRLLRLLFYHLVKLLHRIYTDRHPIRLQALLSHTLHPLRHDLRPSRAGNHALMPRVYVRKPTPTMLVKLRLGAKFAIWSLGATISSNRKQISMHHREFKYSPIKLPLRRTRQNRINAIVPRRERQIGVRHLVADKPLLAFEVVFEHTQNPL
jgi:hypothetical protein